MHVCVGKGLCVPVCMHVCAYVCAYAQCVCAYECKCVCVYAYKCFNGIHTNVFYMCVHV